MPAIPRQCLLCGIIYWSLWDGHEPHVCESQIENEIPKALVPKQQFSNPVEKKQKKLNTFKCKCCNKSFQCTHKHRVYCSPECYHHDKVKIDNEKWLSHDSPRVKDTTLKGYKVNDKLNRRAVYYSEGWMKPFKAVRG